MIEDNDFNRWRAEQQAIVKRLDHRRGTHVIVCLTLYVWAGVSGFLAIAHAIGGPGSTGNSLLGIIWAILFVGSWKGIDIVTMEYHRGAKP